MTEITLIFIEGWQSLDPNSGRPATLSSNRNGAILF